MPCGTFISRTMMVMITAITPSLNASSRPLCTRGLCLARKEHRDCPLAVEAARIGVARAGAGEAIGQALQHAAGRRASRAPDGIVHRRAFAHHGERHVLAGLGSLVACEI